MNLVRFAAGCALALGLQITAQTVPPLHTDGYRILDNANSPVQLLSVNWYGADQKDFVAGGLDRAPLDTIADEIVSMGFNSVRFPWSNEMWEHDPAVPDYALAANPKLQGKHARELMDIVIAALTKRHLMIILDNHMSNADWCCNAKDKNGLWYNDDYPETAWLGDWRSMVAHYKANPWVIGADLRNELRAGAAWGGNDPKLDWHAAAGRGGDAVLTVNPKLLIFVEGPNYSTHLEAFRSLPLTLSVAHRLVYSPHSYAIGVKYTSYDDMAASDDKRFGFLLTNTPAVPVWVGEFGACQQVDCKNFTGTWVRWWIQYCKARGLTNLSYWALNGTQSTGTSRTFGATEGYGLLDTTWKSVAAPKMLELIHSVPPEPPSQ